MYIIPRDCIVPPAGGGLTDSEDESLIEGFSQQTQDSSAFRRVGEVGCT